MHRTSQCNYDDDVILCCSTPTYALEPANIQHSAAASLHKMNQPLSLTHRTRLLCLLTTTNNNKVGSNCWEAAGPFIVLSLVRSPIISVLKLTHKHTLDLAHTRHTVLLLASLGAVHSYSTTGITGLP